MFNRPDNLSVLIHPFDDHQVSTLSGGIARLLHMMHSYGCRIPLWNEEHDACQADLFLRQRHAFYPSLCMQPEVPLYTPDFNDASNLLSSGAQHSFSQPEVSLS